MTNALRTGFSLVGVLLALSSYAADDFAAYRIPTFEATPRFVVDSKNPKWPGNVLNYYYNPTHQPASITTAQMEGVIQNASRKWSDVCNIRFNYLGITTADTPDVDGTFATIDRKSVIGWGALTGSKSGFAGYAAWWWQGNGDLVDSDMVLNTEGSTPFTADNLAELGALVTHEFGHMLAIKHSDEQQSVMFASPYNSYAFQRTLRGDDAAACASLYGPSTNTMANRIFNWAEQTVPQLLAPAGTTSAEVNGIHFRHYTGTGSYLGLMGGQLYFVGANGTPLLLGTPDAFISAATAAGF